MLKQRVLTALVLAALVLVAIFWAPPTMMVVILALLMIAGAWEWSAFPGFGVAARLIYVAVVAAAIAAVWSLRAQGVPMEPVLYLAALWWLMAFVWVIVFPGKVTRASAAVAGLFVLVPAWLALVTLHAQQPQWILFLLLLVVAADVGAYFAGRRFGRHKLAPQVSPGKTWEGVLGGLVAAALMAAIGVVWFGATPLQFILLCVAVVIASVVGDLTESLFKRHAGLKDSGRLLPGHGGVLDRIDSVTAAAPLFVIGAQALGIFA